VKMQDIVIEFKEEPDQLQRALRIIEAVSVLAPVPGEIDDLRAVAVGDEALVDSHEIVLHASVRRWQGT